MDESLGFERIVQQANEIINDYNRRDENKRKLVSCNKMNLNSWLSIPKRIKQEIRGTVLEKVFHERFMCKSSYVQASQKIFMSETTFYVKMKAIFDIAINYMYYEQLFIINDGEISNNFLQKLAF